MQQVTRLLALRALLKKNCHSSPGCWLSGPYSKNCHSSPGCWLSGPYSKNCHSSLGCRLSRLYSFILNYTKALGAGVSKTDLRYGWSHVLANVSEKLRNCNEIKKERKSINRDERDKQTQTKEKKRAKYAKKTIPNERTCHMRVKAVI